MALIAWPAGISLANIKWSQSAVEQVNRSPWSGRTRIARFGAASRWSAQGDFPPMQSSDHVALLGFVMQLQGRVNPFALPVGEADQHALGNAGVVAAGSSGYVLALTGHTPSSLYALPGQFVTVALPSGDAQLIGLASNLATDSTGAASVTLANPMRETPTAGAAVETKRPYGLMRAVDPLAWSVAPGRIYSASLNAEEAF